MPSTDADREKAVELLERARTLKDDEALVLYQEVLQLDPDFAAAHYNVGLIYKYQKKWSESYHYNASAVRLRPNDEASRWNLGIAATALRDWRAAREVWRSLSISVDAGDATIEGDFGMTPVRLNPESDGEVVWARRLDPVRARILNVPFPTSGFRCHDVVLHDGAPVGYRELDGEDRPVFNVLELFQASDLTTYEAEVSIGSDGDIQALTSDLEKADVLYEDWTSNVRTLCKQCSEGRVHQNHDEDIARREADRFVIGCAVIDPTIVSKTLDTWENRKRRVVRFGLKLGPPIRH
jgi:tetratricopeptide (TPR) repeat protein